VGTLRRMRGTRSKLEVVFKRLVSKALMSENKFFIDDVLKVGMLRALRVLFSSFGALFRFSEPAATPPAPRVIVCLLAHYAFVVTKVRVHLQTRADADDSDAEGEDDDDDDMDVGADEGADMGQVLNRGHHEEWVDDLVTVDNIFSPLVATAVNGLRISELRDPRRTNTTHPPTPQLPPAVADNVAAIAAAGRGALAAAATGQATDARGVGRAPTSGVGDVGMDARARGRAPPPPSAGSDLCDRWRDPQG